MDFRLARLTHWAEQTLGGPVSVTPVSGDASFRRYFRVSRDGHPALIAMDAPPDKEDCRPFIAIATHWARAGIAVPALIAQDLEQGFLLLEDFGDTLYLGYLAKADEAATRACYSAAIASLHQIQACNEPPDFSLPPYDEAMLWREMELFRHWLTAQSLGLSLSDAEGQLLDATWRLLVENALAQPRVTVHRDYHSRNLMMLPDKPPGILDFQDAVTGPVTYDLVSLLRDCYIVLPEALVEALVADFWRQTRDDGRHQADLAQFTRWFDLMGIQRHLKAAGIFSRLSIRDGKHGYLADIPRTVGYIRKVSARYPELDTFSSWLDTRFLPLLPALQSAAHRVPG